LVIDPAVYLLAAVTAAQNGIAPTKKVTSAIKAGGSDVRLDDLGFDSLGQMEFCISIELQTGAELTPDLLFDLSTLADVSNWVAAHRP
jgi:acyl carrier protein